MDISDIAIKIFILMLPGAAAAVLVDKLTVHKEWKAFRFFINAIILGLLSYLLLQLGWNFSVFIYNLFIRTDAPSKTLSFWSALLDKKSIDYKEVLFASICGIAIGLITAYLENNQLIYKLGQKLKIGNKFGHQNLYSTFSNRPDVGWVYVRDYKNNLTYFGHIDSFSETEDLTELVLNEVSVYTIKSKPLYEVKKIYLSFIKTDIVIESPL